MYNISIIVFGINILIYNICISNMFSHASASVNSLGGFNEIHNITICNQTSGYD